MSRLVSQKDPNNRYNFIFLHQAFYNMVTDYPTFEIEKMPTSWRVDDSKNGENYKNFVLTMGLKTNRSMRVLDHKAIIIFKRRNSDNLVEINCEPCKNYIDLNDKDIEFYFPITPTTYNKIESVRNGGHLEVYLLIEEMFLHPYLRSKKNRLSPQSITTFYRDDYESYRHSMGPVIINHDTTACGDCKQTIIQEDWAEKVIEPLGMGERFIIEIPCKFPEMPEGTYNEKILQVKAYLEDGIESLRDCIDEYNKIKDHEKCAMKLRKESAEILHRLPHDHTGTGKNFEHVKAYKEFLIEKSGAGTDNISKEMIDEMFKIIDTIYSLSSKIGAHSFNKDYERFDYVPETEDSQMLLGITSLIYYWMGKKFERAAIKQIAESEAEGETEEA